MFQQRYDFLLFRVSLRRDWEMREMHKNVWLGSLKEKDHFENLVVDRNFIVKTCLRPILG